MNVPCPPDAELSRDRLLTELEDLRQQFAELEKRHLTETQRFHELVDMMPQSVFESNLEGMITFSNEFGRIFTGYSQEDLNRGLNILQLITPEERDAARARSIRIIKGVESGGQPYTLIRKDGSTVPVLIHSAPVHRDGKVVGLRGVLTDLSALKTAETALHAWQMSFHNIVARADWGVLVVDEQLHVCFTNDAVAELINVPRRSLFERPFPYDIPAGTTREVEVPVTDGFPRFIELHAVETMWFKLTARLISVRDITDRKRAEREAQVNIQQATRILQLIHGESPRSIPLTSHRNLFIEGLTLPCKAAGGDHFFVRPFPANGNLSARTILSVKDQSGHEVSCVLRSIVTDLLHGSLLIHHPHLTVAEAMERLNNGTCDSGLFEEDDFLTALTAQIDHQSLKMISVSAGHPPFLIIRNGVIREIPSSSLPISNFPLGSLRGVPFTPVEIELQPGDRLLWFTDGLLERLSVVDEKPGVGLLRKTVERFLAENPEILITDLVRRILETAGIASRHEGQYRLQNTGSDDVTIVGIEIETLGDWTETTLVPQDVEFFEETILALSRRIGKEWEALGLANASKRVRRALEEACWNAWKHGNHHEPALPIEIRWRSGNDFHLQVKDRGPGFDLEEALDPRTPPNRLREHGRGIFMIRLAADDLTWFENGSRIQISFRRNFPRPRGSSSMIAGLLPFHILANNGPKER